MARVARTAAQRAAWKKWQAAGAAARKKKASAKAKLKKQRMGSGNKKLAAKAKRIFKSTGKRTSVFLGKV